MAMTMLVTGLVNTVALAATAVQRIRDLGYAREDISVIVSDKARERFFSLESESQAAAGAGIGSAVGCAVIAAIAAVAAIGTSVVLPGLGLVAGPIAAALAGAGAGGATGGAIGALVGAGIPALRAHIYESGLHKGLILVGVEARSVEDAEELERLFKELGATQVRFATTKVLPVDCAA